ncbi:double-strand break repair helicase AddA [Seohaeicola saemankumensis]|nr:double-strand break repair helicase AddA [Seohaeicola saemankumensis]MCA0870451.1 double-strand break repair helicase AddA [Seohaeicola saemankumensis]
MTARNEATERQVQASMPNMSTWLAANAGSGKTRVLTDRVARLLLNNVEPQHILCLTYTKAAASEMQNRLFARLGNWAMLDDAQLREALTELGSDNPANAAQLAHARTLFARAIETPGGLKIQTIHSFCASLLRRFPLEAGVSPRFAEMEDRAAALLRAEIVEDMADGPDSAVVDSVARFVTDQDFDALTAAVTGRRGAFSGHVDDAALQKAFGLTEHSDENAPINVGFDGTETDLIRQAAPILATQSPTMVRLAETLAGLPWDQPDMATLETLYPLFLYSEGGGYRAEAKLKSVPTKKAQDALGSLLEPFQALMSRVAHARETELALAAVEKSKALHRFANVFLPEYERRKQLRGWLDFDDLILKARQLLTDPAVAAWVLYRLDGGIDHILVDEAQDTSPEQWDVIEKLAQEFTSGLGARADIERTIFVVGDKKQSIYSFQGADPDAFDRMQAEFSTRLEATGTQLQDLTLEFSFRSAQAILKLVDLVFAERSDAGFHKDAMHRAFKTDLPGRVDLWPVVEKVDDSDDRIWTDPVDRPGARHHTVILADRIASTIKKLIDEQETIPIDGSKFGDFARRAVQPGDFLILVQRRSELFAEIIRACKAADLPIAGADRLKVGAELAVRDLAALLSFLATPEDDLSLATVLKSPLFGWSEQQLFDLAHHRRDDFLWQALRRRETEFPDTLTILHDLRDQADFLRPYDLIDRILTRHDGRRKLLARLGAEAEDGINALLSQALAYERTDIPSLTGFLVWMETDDLEIKRQMGNAGNMIRVMTVHGAKGLEAPIVILPDTGARKPPKTDEILMHQQVPLWRTRADRTPAAIATARDALRDKQMNERMRLLYVALTRAEKWLIVAAAGDLDRNGDSWYQMVEAAMPQVGAETFDFGFGYGLRLADGEWTEPPIVAMTPSIPHHAPLPDLFRRPAVLPPPPLPTLSPSDLGGAKALPGEAGQDEEGAKVRGTRIHRLLEILPTLDQQDWQTAARSLLPDCEADLPELFSEASAVLNDPKLAWIFDNDALTEVSATAQIRQRRVHGIIDRLINRNGVLTAIDYKSNAEIPDTPDACPEGLLRQMGAYAAMLEQIYPGQKIETAILWTRAPSLMYLPHDLVTAALARATCLDETGMPT